jgi:TetR/AcrR family transcriptional regulator, tetracycline repressor protein
VDVARPGPKRTLSEARLLAAAHELLTEKGADGLSVRGIAARVGVAPNAVYTYFPDRAAVLSALVDGVLGAVPAPAPGPWRARLVELALALRAELLARPGVVPLVGRVPLDGPHALALGELLLDVLAGAGLDPGDAARAAYLLQVYVLGAVALDVAEVEPGPLPPEDERVATRAAALAGVPEGHHPRTAAAAPVIAGYVTVEQFRWGLDRILDGIAAP